MLCEKPSGVFFFLIQISVSQKILTTNHHSSKELVSIFLYSNIYIDSIFLLTHSKKITGTTFFFKQSHCI